MNFAASSRGTPTATPAPAFLPRSSKGEKEADCVNCLLCVTFGSGSFKLNLLSMTSNPPELDHYLTLT